MIKIQTNPKLFQLHKEAMSEKIIDEINKILKKRYIGTDEKSVRIYPRTRVLLRYIREHVSKFIISDIHQQEQLISWFHNRYPELTKKYKDTKSKPNIYKVVRYLFETRGYNEFTGGFKYNNKTKEYGAYRFVELINLKTCPYCNRNYISMIKEIPKVKESKKRRPELDHFHPKSIYPFLAVNFYNLIPSCSTCNKLKSDDDSVGLLHPYDPKNDNINFTYWLNDMKFYKVKSLKDITFESEESITIDIENIPKNNLDTFQVERLYQEHKDIVIELILKYLHYPKSYIDELASFGYGEEEVYRFIFSNYLNNDDLSKKPLSKLTRDIADELGLLEYIEEETKVK